MSDCRGLMRRKLLEEIYDSLSPEDKRTFVHLTLQDMKYSDIMQALQSQRQDIAEIRKDTASHTWLRDFSSNVAGNAAWDGAVWLFSRLLRRL